MRTFTEDDSLSVIINSHYNTKLNETAFFSFTQLFPFTEMIRGDKNDLISLAVLLFPVVVYAYTSKTSKHGLLAVLVGHSVW